MLVKRKRFREIPYIEGILLVLKSVLCLKIEPLLMTLSVRINVQIKIILRWTHILSPLKVTTFEKRVEDQTMRAYSCKLRILRGADSSHVSIHTLLNRCKLVVRNIFTTLFRPAQYLLFIKLFLC